MGLRFVTYEEPVVENPLVRSVLIDQDEILPFSERCKDICIVELPENLHVGQEPIIGAFNCIPLYFQLGLTFELFRSESSSPPGSETIPGEEIRDHSPPQARARRVEPVWLSELRSPLRG